MTTRQRIVAAARWGLANEPQIHYGQLRPMPLTRALPLTTDCSGFVTLCYYLAGAPDPNGLDYDGQGWTGTLLSHLDPTVYLRPGDIVVWGAYPGHHCALVLEAGDDPLMCSHGRERGPLAIRYSDECLLQPPIVAWLTPGTSPTGSKRRRLEGDEGEADEDGERQVPTRRVEGSGPTGR